MASVRLSIIMPVLNEAAVIEAALRRLSAQAPGAEVVVVDGGSTDATAALAAPLARVVSSAQGQAAPKNRAVQMNRGAWESTGDWLLFLHADTQLPAGFEAEVARLAARGCRAGAFRLRIAGRHPLLPLLAWAATQRTRWLRIALGDQALFCSRALFLEQQGFPPLPILEDYVWSRRLRRSGVRLCLARSAATTSGRRWDQLGFWRTWWQFRMIYSGFRRAPDLQEVRQHYEDVR